MEGDFDVIIQRKYTSQHCNQDYAVRIDTVKVELEKEKQQEAYWKMSLEQQNGERIRGRKQEEGRGVAPSTNSVGRPDLENYKNIIYFLESSFIFRV
jgi:hypothetical protein